jgi:Xaa-Pro aminopeptidase
MRKGSDIYRRRRQRVLNRLGSGLLILPTSPLTYRNGDVFHEFRPDSDFYYLTGFDEPEAVLVASRASSRTHRSVLFVRERDPEREIWDGERAGPTRARNIAATDSAHPIAELYTAIEKELSACSTLFYTLGRDRERDWALGRIFERLSIQNHRGNPSAHPTLTDPKPTIAVERLVKDAEELAAIARAADVTARGHETAMRFARPGLMEYEVQAELEASFRRSGSRRNGYESIVASGPNACTLHYTKNDRRLRSGDLLLIDAGAELGLYTADVTRTFPVSGRFTEEQKAVYRVVLRAQKVAIRAVKAGRPWDAPHRAAVRVVVDGLRELGLLRTSRQRAIEKKTYRRWFMHGTSHWLGMDVHDAGGYEVDGKPRALEPGMVLTIEPGLYFGPRDRTVPKRYRGIGVRIEDDVVVTGNGARVLTESVPKEIRDVEAACQEPDSIA